MPKELNEKTEEKSEENSVANEIDDMLSSFDQPTSEEEKEEEKEVEKPSEEEKPAEETKTEEDKIEEKSAKDEEEDPEKDEEPKEKPTEKSVDEPDEKDKTIADLNRKITDLEARPVEKKEEEKKEEEPAEEEVKLESQDFVGDREVDDLFHDKDSVNEFMNEIYSRGVKDTRSVVGEHILRNIPEIVRTNLLLHAELTEARVEFYKENPDLEGFPRVVAAVFEEVSAKSPDKGFKDMLEEVGKEARIKLDLHKKATEEDPSKGDPSESKKKEVKPPRLPGKKGTRTSGDQPNVTSLESEIGEMNKTVGR